MTENNQTEETQNEVEPTEAQEQEAPAAEEEAAAPEEAEAKGEGEEGSEEDAAPQEPPKPDDKHKRQGGWQRKIERQERELQQLRQQVAALAPAQQTQPAKEKTPDEKAADYVDQLVEKRLAAREQARQQQEAQAQFQRRTEEVRAKHPDFDEVLLSADAPVSPALSEALLTSEHGPEIMYQLAKNPAELARLSALPPLVAAREIGRLEAKASSTAAPKTPPKPATRPPAPPTNLGGSASRKGSLEDLPLSEYKRAYRSGQR